MSSVLVLTGGDLPHILTHSKEPGIERGRRKILDKHGITLDEMEKKIREKIRTDPARYAASIDARRVLMMLAMFDEIVPIEKGEELARLIGYPERIYLPTGHYSAVVFIFYARSAALRFFDKQFGL